MENNLACEDLPRQELIGGRSYLMSPASPLHTYIGGNIFLIFGNYLKGKQCVPLHDNTTVHLTKTDHFVPDFMVVCDRSKIKSNWVEGAPDLVAEILSPSTARNDRFRKKDVYEACGVPEYWLVSPTDQSVEVYLLRNGKYELEHYCVLYTEDTLSILTEQEKAEAVTEFKCHLYDDLTIRLADIFDDLI